MNRIRAGAAPGPRSGGRPGPPRSGGLRKCLRNGPGISTPSRRETRAKTTPRRAAGIATRSKNRRAKSWRPSTKNSEYPELRPGVMTMGLIRSRSDLSVWAPRVKSAVNVIALPALVETMSAIAWCVRTLTGPGQYPPRPHFRFSAIGRSPETLPFPSWFPGGRA